MAFRASPLVFRASMGMSRRWKVGVLPSVAKCPLDGFDLELVLRLGGVFHGLGYRVQGLQIRVRKLEQRSGESPDDLKGDSVHELLGTLQRPGPLARENHGDRHEHLRGEDDRERKDDAEEYRDSFPGRPWCRWFHKRGGVLLSLAKRAYRRSPNEPERNADLVDDRHKDEGDIEGDDCQ